MPVRSVYVLCIFITVASVLYSADTSLEVQVEEKYKLEIFHSLLIQTEFNQTLAKDDKSNGAKVAKIESGLGFSIDDMVRTMVMVEKVEENAVAFLEGSLLYQPVEFLGITAGLFCMPFGELATEMLTDPVILAEVETIEPGIMTAFDKNGWYVSAALFNSVVSGHLDAFAVKLKYFFKDIASVGISSRIEDYKQVDLDVGFSLTPLSNIKLLGEIYLRVAGGGVFNYDPFGFLIELDLLPEGPFIFGAKYEQLADRVGSRSGINEIIALVKYGITDLLGVGIQGVFTSNFENGERGDWIPEIKVQAYFNY